MHTFSEYGFSLIRIFRQEDIIYDSVLIRKNTGWYEPLLWHLFHSIITVSNNIKFSSKILNPFQSSYILEIVKEMEALQFLGICQQFYIALFTNVMKFS